MTLTYILAAIILLGFCIFVHELGHLLGGKMVGIKAKIFSIGYGKGIVKKKVGDTTYQITLIPFGGYCQFYGEDPKEKRAGEDYEFLSAHPLKRIVVVIMGPLFNLFFGILLFFIMNTIGYPTETNRVSIPDAMKSEGLMSPAYKAGIRDGDRIIEINGEKVYTFSDIRIDTLFSKGEPLRVKVERNSKNLDFLVEPKRFSEKGFYAMGVMPYGERVLIVRTLEDDVADEAGIEQFDEIKRIDGRIIKTPKEFTKYIRANPGKDVSLQIYRSGKDIDLTIKPRLKELITIQHFEDNRFKGEKYTTTIERLDIIRNAINDRKLKINGKIIASFGDFVNNLNRNAGRAIRIENSGGTYYGICKYEKFGFVGVETAVSSEMIEVNYGILSGFARAIVEPFDFIIMNMKAFGMLFSGKLNVRESISGPIRIAKIAGDVAYYKGSSAFIILMAKISIILMIMNLLPIPAVDGSYIIFFIYETIRGKPINEKVLEKIQFVGISILIILGGFVIFNDLSFFPFFQKLFN